MDSGRSSSETTLGFLVSGVEADFERLAGVARLPLGSPGVALSAVAGEVVVLGGANLSMALLIRRVLGPAKVSRLQ